MRYLLGVTEEEREKRREEILSIRSKDFHEFADDGRVKSDIAKIKSGERPMIPSTFPRYLNSFIKRCWHADPKCRPSFSSICRILKHIKRKLFLVPDPNSAQDLVPSPDLCDIETSLAGHLPQWGTPEFGDQVANIPLQMFAFRVMEREKIMKYSAAASVVAGIKSVDKIVAAAEGQRIVVTKGNLLIVQIITIILSITHSMATIVHCWVAYHDGQRHASFPDLVYFCSQTMTWSLSLLLISLEKRVYAFQILLSKAMELGKL